MQLYYEIIKLLFKKYIGRRKTGEVVKDFSEKMGVVYIKLAQILSTQNFDNLFTEEDRVILSSVCDDCKMISFDKIKEIIESEYKLPLEELFLEIDPTPVGAASISQVHRAVLKNGEVVALKIKRRDITNNIEKDINKIKKLMYRFGKIIRFGNFSGGSHALDLYLKWILEETDFSHEVENIKKYINFAKSVNGRVDNTKEIKVSKLYEDLCTENIIVMEFVTHKTINQLELNDENCKKIKTAINSYISSSFYALFNDLPIIFHGDPHNGNIYLDENGNVGFLDMGLLFELNESDTKLVKDFFFAAYTRNFEKMYTLITNYSKMDDKAKIKFKQDVKNYCDNLSNEPLTAYFVNIMNICSKYEVCPPDFLFCMAKSFICLGGISDFSKNDVSGSELLRAQVIEYFIRKNISANQNLMIKSIKLMPSFVEGICKYGLVRGILKGIMTNEDLKTDIKEVLTNYRELLEVISPSIQEIIYPGDEGKPKVNVINPKK